MHHVTTSSGHVPHRYRHGKRAGELIGGSACMYGHAQGVVSLSAS